MSTPQRSQGMRSLASLDGAAVEMERVAESPV